MSLWAKPTILISYFDAFGGAKFNNSSIISSELVKRFDARDELQIEICPLNTVFDKSFRQLEYCINQIAEEPLMILGLGEAICNLKVETIARNKDKTYGPDNEGNERQGTIIKGVEDYIGLRYPLHEMYCSLKPEERKTIVVSNDAGSFVCNNLMFKMAHYYPQYQFGFIHVPAHKCDDLVVKNLDVTNQLEKMLIGVIEAFKKPARGSSLPHWENQYRFPVERQSLKDLRNENSKDECLQEFTAKLKSHDSWNWFRNLKHHN